MKRALLLGSAALALTIPAAIAYAQRGDVRRPLTVTVGQGAGPATTVRSDARRDGLARAAFPRAPLHVDWRFSVGGGNIEQPPVVSNEAIIVVTTHGDVVWVPHDAKDKSELARQPIGIAASSSSAPTLLSDGTVVVVGGSTDAIAVGVDKNGVRFRTQLAGAYPGDNPLDAVAPLALDDGGVAVATASEIALLDASGNVRVRAPLPETLTGPLLASAGRILAVSKTGVVYSWAPGGANGRDVSRVGSFQAPVQGGAVLTSEDTLLAVVGDARLMTLDVRQGLAVPLASFTGGGYLGPVAYRKPSGSAAGTAYAMAGVPGRTFAIGVDSSGQEVLRVPVATSTVVTADGGAPAFSIPAHVPVAIDDTGTLAFAAPEGPVGIVDPAGVVSSIDGICTRTLRNGRGVTSLVSGGPGAFLVTCATASVVRIVHGTSGGDLP